jgi:hypothetical protein
MSVLTVSRVEAAKRLQDQTAKGEELLTKRIGSKGDLDDARDRYYTWTEYNEDLLKTLFESSRVIRRLQPLKGWSHDETKQVSARSS